MNDWSKTLADAYRTFRAAPDEPPGFLEGLRPLMMAGRTRLSAALDARAAQSPLPFDRAAIVERLIPLLAHRLRQIVERTLVLELNVERLRGSLAGETSEERFRSFLLQLRDPERALALLAEYPVLAEQATLAVDQWVAFYAEFLGYLVADWDAIRRELNGGADPGPLQEIGGGMGDSHREGRSVLIAHFASGFTTVYKPRSMALDRHFQELLGWLNERGVDPQLRTLRLVDGGDHGWVEFVEARGCSTADEVDRFYRRQGAYLALLYALDATDFHSENLIAEGEHPVLLDLEALFHAHFGTAVAINPALRAASRSLESSVLRVGLLPQRIWGNAESEGIDLSGLGSVAGQKTPFRVPHWQSVGTDEMHLGREHITMPVGKSRPTLNGVPVDVMDHTEAIVAGFTATYRLLEQHRGELLADRGRLASFANDEVRVILRATQTYGVVLRESYHPDMLRSAQARAELFQRLRAQVEYLPHLARAIPSEIADMQRGDVPMFTTHPTSRDLWSSTGERLPEFLEEPSLSHVRRRIEQLGNKDLEQQLWYVRASMATISRRPIARSAADARRSSAAVTRDELLAGARAVGDELARRALVEDGTAIWIGLTQPGERHWILAPLGMDLYDGLPGVALFLSYLALATGEERYASLARAAFRPIEMELVELRSQLTSIGGFAGLGGLIYALTHLGALWREAALLDEAESMVDVVAPLVERDDTLDIIGGAAGCIGALLCLDRHRPRPRTLAVARQCGERLLHKAKTTDSGIGWLTTIAQNAPLSGFSHGGAGMAWSLLQLASVAAEPRYRNAALDAIAYERSLFSPEQENWLDLREMGGSLSPARCATAWCHGAPGIGLARLSTLALLDDERVRREIDSALSSTAKGFGENHSLCHGDLGNLELLLAAADVFADVSLRASGTRVLRGIVDDIARTGWRCGNPLRVESPGLLTGLAGIGYGLLRAAEPARVPSVLLLEPPRPEP